MRTSITPQRSLGYVPFNHLPQTGWGRIRAGGTELLNLKDDTKHFSNSDQGQSMAQQNVGGRCSTLWRGNVAKSSKGVKGTNGGAISI